MGNGELAKVLVRYLFFIVQKLTHPIFDKSRLPTSGIFHCMYCSTVILGSHLTDFPIKVFFGL
ncbi:hypothetical protein, partial [Muricomes intestini]|uniref:hypothetical protein n=1 Tax=Muricomes intestini TaxID=1796634 RepID=UPI002FDD10A7